MTQYIYLASPLKLPKGSFGSTPISPEQPNFFKDEYDFAELYFENNYDSKTKRKFSYSPHFSFEYQVAAMSYHIPLKHRERGDALERKCLNILHSYLEDAIQASGVLEYFTSLSGKEHGHISNKRKISWSEIKSPYDLVLDDMEFWTITL